MPSWLIPYINQQDYTAVDFFIFLICFLCWTLAYWEIIVNIYRHRYVDMPIVAATGNLVWEFLLGFIFKIDLGIAAVWGVRLWFFMDVVINFFLLVYGSKQMIVPEFKKAFRLLYFFLLAVWSGILYSFIYMKMDNGMGAVTAMISNVVMSFLYIMMVYRKPDLWRISVRTGWYKFLGTGSIAFISFHTVSFRHNYFLLTLGVIAFLLDAYYIYLLWYLKTFKGGKIHTLQKRNLFLKKAGFDPLSRDEPIIADENSPLPAI